MLGWIITLPFRILWRLILTIFGFQPKKKSKNKAARENTPFTFNQELTYDDFKAAVYESVESYDSIINIEIEGPSATISVKRKTGIFLWYFKVNFNDYGLFTGKYWIERNNKKSKIPESVANRIVEKCISTIQYNKRLIICSTDNQKSKIYYFKCEHCGKYVKPVEDRHSFYCLYCGEKISTSEYHSKDEIDNNEIINKQIVEKSKIYYYQKYNKYRQSVRRLKVIAGILLLAIDLWLLIYLV